MNRNIIIITVICLVLIIFGIILTTYGIIKFSNIKVEKNFSSTIVNEDFDLFIYTPPAYSLKYKESYPVLYILDGEKFFKEKKEEQRTQWSMQKTLDRLVKGKQMKELVVVGISTTENKIVHDASSNELDLLQGKGEVFQFARFLTEELKPYIDSKYRTKKEHEQTGIAGVGLEGLIAFNIGRNYPEQFSMIGVLTPNMWGNENELLSMIQNNTNKTKEQKIWLDEEVSYNHTEEELDQRLENMLIYLFSN